MPRGVAEGGPLGYIALYQRIRNRTLPPAGPAALQYKEPLRLAFSAALKRRPRIAELEFRTDRPIERTIVRAPAESILHVFAERARHNALRDTTYHLVARDFRLGTPIETKYDYTTGALTDYEYKTVLQNERPGHAVLYAQFARYIAAGFQHGFSLQVYLTNALQHLGVPGRSGGSADSLRSHAARHVAALIAAAENEPDLLALREDDELDARAVLHLARIRSDDAEKHATAARSREAGIRRRLQVYELDSPETNIDIDKLLRIVPCRLLIEECGKLPRPNAYFWTRLQPDDTRAPVERLLKLDSSTATFLQRELHKVAERLPAASSE